MRVGLDRLVDSGYAAIRGKWVGVLCNQATVDSSYRHILDLLLPGHRTGQHRLGAVLGPEHGLYGHTQDNMIEWEGAPDPRTDLIVHSLYGAHREPTDAMLEGVDLLLVDVPDIGSRYYTFAWTMALCQRAAARLGIPVLVLDRPNPISRTVEGTVLEEEFSSFVGLHPLPSRHGWTLGEIARYVQDRYYPGLRLEVIPADSVSPEAFGDETGAPWAMPSPNMPTVDTAIVYPGGCLIEATNLSEGRGTTRPFEIVGAPYLDGGRLAESLGRHNLPGVVFRPIQFEPTFNKHAGKLCEGVFVHVTDRRAFRPWITYVAILQDVFRQVVPPSSQKSPVPTVVSASRRKRFSAHSWECDEPHFAWKHPPYEYDFDHWPIDLLAGNDWLRPAIESLESLAAIEERARAEREAFADRWVRAQPA